MICARCQRENEAGSSYCRFCGASVTPRDPARRFVRLPDEGKIAGVCAGLAAYFDTDVTVVRLAWVILSIIPGVFIGGLVAYAAAWIVTPVATSHSEGLAGKHLTRSEADRKIAGVCGGLAEYFELDATIVRLAAVILAVYPGAVIGGIVVYLIAWFIMPAGPVASLQPASSS